MADASPPQSSEQAAGLAISPVSDSEAGRDASQMAAGSQGSGAASPQLSGPTRRALFGITRGLSSVVRAVGIDVDEDALGSDDVDDGDDFEDDGDDDYDDDDNAEDATLDEEEDDDVPVDDDGETDRAITETAGGAALAAGAVGTASMLGGAPAAPNNTQNQNGPPSRYMPAGPAPNGPPRNTPTKQNSNTTRPNETSKNVSSASGSKVEANPAGNPSSNPASKPDPLAPTEAAPYGYKIVKVKKADGSIAKVKRPLKAEEAAAKAATAPNEPSSQQGAVRKPSEKSEPTIEAGVSIKQSVAYKSGDPKSEIRITEKELLQDDASGPQTPRSPPDSHSALRTTARVMQLFSMFVMIVFPLLFLAMSIWIAKWNGHRLDESAAVGSSDIVSQFQKVAASLWPIIFAAVVAQTLKTYAAYRVERGIELMQLEQLTSSHSVGGALKQPFVLRGFNLTTVILFVIWALSPLAGQAILRMATVEPAQAPSKPQVKWFAPQSMNYSNVDFAFYKNQTSTPSVPKIQAMYSALLLGDQRSQNSISDFWNNVKIPVYDTGNGKQIDDGWLNLTSKTANKSSLLGIPTAVYGKAPAVAQYNFVIDTSSFSLQCSPWAAKNLTDTSMQALKFSKSNAGQFYVSADNTTTIPQFASPAGANGAQASAGSSPSLVPVKVPGPSGNLHFGTINRTARYFTGEGTARTQLPITTIMYTNCSYKQAVITNMVNCTKGTQSGDLYDCYVSRQKPKQDDSQNLPPLGALFAPTMAQIAVGESTGPLAGFSNTEEYLANPFFVSKVFVKGEQDLLVDTIARNLTDAAELSKRMAVLVNTLWMLGTAYQPFLGGDDLAVVASSYSGTGGPLRLNEVTADATQTVYDYRVNWPWLIVLVVCSVILLVAGVAAAIFEELTIGPEFLGFANTALRRSVKLPADLNQLSARDRLERLRRSEVLLQDARPQKDVGKIVLGIREETSNRLVKGRKYL